MGHYLGMVIGHPRRKYENRLGRAMQRSSDPTLDDRGDGLQTAIGKRQLRNGTGGDADRPHRAAGLALALAHLCRAVTKPATGASAWC